MPSIYTEFNSPDNSFQHTASIEASSPANLAAIPTTRYVSAMCGAGKTHALGLFLKKRLSSFGVWKAPNTVYVCQSKKLMKQFASLLHSLGVKKTHQFNSDINDKVVAAIRDFMQLETTTDGGHVVLITHQAYLFAAHLIDRRHWSIYIDEIPQITVAEMPDIQFSNSWLAGVIEGKQFNAKLIELSPKNHKALDAYLKSSDDGLKPFHTLLHSLKSRSHRCFATVDSYHTLKNESDNTNKSDFRFCYITVVNATIFADTTILAANVEQSMFSDHLIRNGIQMVRHEELSAMLRYHEYPEETRRRIRIEHILKRKYSKTLGKKKTESGSTVKAEMDQRVLSRVGERKCLLLPNKGDDGSLAKSPFMEHLPPKSSGINDYSDHTTIICMVAYNRNHTNVKMHKALGFSERSIRHTTLVEEIHQAIMRTNVRVPDSNAEVLVILTDAVIANEIAQLVGCANATIVEGPDIVPKKSPSKSRQYQPLTKTQINQRSMTNNYFNNLGLDESSCSLDSLQEVGDSMGCNYLKSIDTKCPIETSSDNSTPDAHTLIGKRKKPGTKSTLREADTDGLLNEHLFTFTFHNKKDDYKRSQFKTDTFTLRELVNRLKSFASTTYESKDQRRMYNPAEFEPYEHDHRYRTQMNWLASSAMVLDFDSGKVTPEDFIRIFLTDCTDAEKIAFIIYNSFSRSDKEPNRFHVVIPYLMPIFDLRVHKAIFDYIEHRLEKANFPSETSGLDRSLSSGVQSLYCPCTNRKYPESAFFKTFGMDKKQFKKFGLNPQGFKTTIELPAAVSSIPTPKREANSPQQSVTTLREDTDREVEAIRSMTSGRHRSFFILAHMLYSCRYSQSDALAKMLYAAEGEAEMIKKAHWNINQVYKWRPKIPIR
jgi:hypothetical protein